MTDRVMALAAAVALALTLAACGGADKKPQTRPDPTPRPPAASPPAHRSCPAGARSRPYAGGTAAGITLAPPLAFSEKWSII